MIKGKIEFEGETSYDVVIAIEEALRRIKSGDLSSQDENGGSKFSFTISTDSINEEKNTKKIKLTESQLKQLIERVVERAEQEQINEAKGEKFIQGAIKHKGALKKELGVKKDEKIPDEKLNSVISKLEKKGEGKKKLSPAERKELRRAVLAKTLRGIKK